MSTAPRWRLDDLPVPPGAEELRARSRHFEQLEVAAMDAPTLAAALDELGELRAALQLHALGVELPLLVDDGDDAARRRLPDLDDLLADVDASTRPFELALTMLADEPADQLLADVRLARHRQHIRRARRFRAHVLPEHDEELLARREPAAEDAWQRLFEHVSNGLQGDGESRPAAVVFGDLQSAQRDRRRAAMLELERAVKPYAEVLARCADTLIADRLAMDELRGFSSPRAQTDLENDLPAATVDAALAAIERHRPLVRRWNEAKAALLGLDALTAADEQAPLPGLPALSYSDAVGVIAEAFDSLSPDLGELVVELDRGGHIDAQPRRRKRSLATCVSAGAGTLPFVAVTFTGQPGDMLTLAHEIGHALHYALSVRAQSPLDYDPATPLAEMAAVFAELLVLDHLAAEHDDLRAVTAAQRMDFTARTVFRQAMITRFETTAYAARADGDLLTAQRLTELWLDARRWLHGDAPIATDDLGWALVPHVIHHRFYNYAYALAALTATSLLGQWHADPERFPTRYVTFLSLGGAAPVPDQLARLGLDSAGSWHAALDGLRTTLDACRAIGAGTA